MIYFIQHGEGGPIKIGYTTDDSTFHSRLSTMQTCSPVELIPLGLANGKHCDERELHELFDEERIRGEWFQPDEALLRYILTWARRIKDKPAADLLPAPMPEPPVMGRPRKNETGEVEQECT